MRKPYGMVAPKCPECGTRMKSETYVSNNGMIMQKATCPLCGKIIDRSARKQHFPDRDAI